MKTLKHLTKPLGMTLIASALISGPLMDMGSASLSQELARTSIQPVASSQQNQGNYVVINMDNGDQVKIYWRPVQETTYTPVYVDGVPQPNETGVTQTNWLLECDFGCTRDSFTPFRPSAGRLTAQQISEQVKRHLQQSENATVIGNLYTARKRYERDLEKAQEDVANCEARITVNNRSTNTIETESLSGPDNREDRLECKVEKFEDGDFESDREERREFDRLFAEEIAGFVQDGDREGLHELYEQFDGRSSFMRGVFSEANRMATVGSTINRYDDMLSDTNMDPMQRQLLQGEVDILKQQTNLRWGNIPNQAGLNSLIQSRNSLLDSIQRLRDSVLPTIDVGTTSFDRGRRSTIDSSIPRPGSQTIGGQRLGGQRLMGNGTQQAPFMGPQGQMPNGMPNGGRPY